MKISEKMQAQLDNWARHEPALNDSSKPAGESGFKLGSELAKASSAGSVAGSWAFARQGGAINTEFKIAELPVGSYVKAVWYRRPLTVTSAGAPTVEIKAGSVTLVALDNTEFEAAQALSLLAPTAPVDMIKVTEATKELKFEILTDAATAGEVEVLVEYLLP